MSTISARRYARAVFEIAREENELEGWQSSLSKLVEAMQDSEIASLLESPKLPFDLKTELIEEKLGGINPLALNLAYLLVSKDRLKDIDQIAAEYERLLGYYYGIKHVEVITAVPLDDAAKQGFKRHLETISGGEVRISLQVDPDIVGGFIAKIDDSLIDASIRNKLSMLRRSLGEARR